MDPKKKISGVSSKYNSDDKLSYSKIHQPMSMNQLELMVFKFFLNKNF